MTTLLGTTLYRQLLRQARSLAKAAEKVPPTAEIMYRLHERQSYWESFLFGNKTFNRSPSDRAAELAYVGDKAAEVRPGRHVEILLRHAFRAGSKEELHQASLEMAPGPSLFKTTLLAVKEVKRLEDQLLIASEWAELLHNEVEEEVEGLSVEERGLALLIAARDGHEATPVYEEVNAALESLAADARLVYESRVESERSEAEYGGLGPRLQSINDAIFSLRGMGASSRQHPHCLYLDVVLEKREVRGAQP